MAAAVAAIERRDRLSHVVRIAAGANLTGPGHTPVATTRASSPPWRSRLDATALVNPDVVPSDSVNSVDLVITSLRPEDGDDRAGDLVALVAARLLRVGGILVVLTHSDWARGELIDPTGALVTSAQNADLLYLQHIVALHAPVRDGRIATEPVTDIDGSIAETQARATHRAAMRGLPTPHLRIHSDLLVFAQPHEHDEPLQVRSAEQALTAGVIR